MGQTKRIRKWFEKKTGIPWFLVFICCCVLFMLALIEAMSSQDPSGWYQVAIELVGFPILVYALFEMRSKILEKPEIEVGVVPDGRTHSDIRKLKSLPTSITVDPKLDTPRFAFIIWNRGKVTARSMKVELESRFSSHGDKLQFILNDLHFRLESNYTVNVCYSVDQQELVVRAGDVAMFPFSVHPLGAHMPYHLDSPLDIAIRCMVWADGLDNSPIKKNLTITFKPT